MLGGEHAQVFVKAIEPLSLVVLTLTKQLLSFEMTLVHPLEVCFSLQIDVDIFECNSYIDLLSTVRSVILTEGIVNLSKLS